MNCKGIHPLTIPDRGSSDDMEEEFTTTSINESAEDGIIAKNISEIAGQEGEVVSTPEKW